MKDPNGVSVVQKVNEFSGEMLMNSLFCMSGGALLEAKRREKPRGVSKALTTQVSAQGNPRSGTRYRTSFSGV